MWKKCLILVLLSALLFCLRVELSWANESQESFAHHLLTVNLEAGQERIVDLPYAFQVFAVSEVEGVRVMFHEEGQWTAWRTLAYEEAGRAGSDLVFVGSSDSFRLLAVRDMQVEVTMLELVYEPVQVASNDNFALDSNILAYSEESGLKIISRRTWGADEAIATYDPDDVDDDDDDGENINICAPL